MTDEERFRFDLTGFLVRPSILTPDEVTAMRDQIHWITKDPAQLPPHHRAVPSGPTEMLVDHPGIIDVIHELVGPYLRLDSHTAVWRERGEQLGLGLHRAGDEQADPIFGYRVQRGRIYAGMVRALVELTDIGPDDGGTLFLPGSHKSEFAIPPEHAEVEGPARSTLLRGYSCPAGSVVFFTENLSHAGPVWRRDDPRVLVILAYHHVAIAYSRLMLPPEVLDGLASQRRAFFRDPWLVDFAGSPDINTLDHYLKTEGGAASGASGG